MLATAEVVYAKIEYTLNRALALVGRVDELYRLGGDQVRRLANQCFLDKLLISVDEDTPGNRSDAPRAMGHPARP